MASREHVLQARAWDRLDKAIAALLDSIASLQVQLADTARALRWIRKRVLER